MKLLEPLVASLAQPVPVYVLVGSEPLLVREAERRLREALLVGPFAQLNHAVHTAGEEGALAFAETAATLPMMAPRRLVEVRQVQDANVALLEALLNYVQAPANGAVLVISGEKFPAASGGMDRGLRIKNAVKKTGVLLELDGEGVDPVAFATARATDLGVRMNRDAAQLLVAFGGGELTTLAADVDKCAAYVGNGGVIDTAAVDAVCAFVAEASAWTLTDAIVTRDKDTALSTLQRLLEDGEAPHKLLGSVAWQLRQVLLVQDVVRRGLSEREAGIRMPPQKLRTLREVVTKRPVSPSALLEELARVNRRMNSSRAGDRRVLEGFVLRLVAG
jgi:DNA polymerase-3 subunit delta